LTWATRRGLLPQLTVPLIPRQEPARILAEDERWNQLSQLLSDTTLPVDVRAAGSLVLLFGLHASRVRHLRTDQLREGDGQMLLAIGSPPVLVPPKLAVLLRQLAEAPPRNSRISASNDCAGPRWLFPGLVPGRPAAPSGFSRKLLDHGIGARPARNAALIALLEDVPPPILADTLGLHINTAVRWADIARRDWTAYLAARDGEPHSPGGTKGTPESQPGQAGTGTRQGWP
ncbi:MAG: hypothetical protein ACRDOE_09445, partial [Streptosporangiaceae bacterium]